MPIFGEITGTTVSAKCWTPVEEVEETAREQLKNIASLPRVVHVAVMPDVHYGKGATVGSVIAMRDAVSPAAVGVDIGCGMLACRTSLCADDLDGPGLARLRAEIEKRVPVGFNAHDHDQVTPLYSRNPELFDAINVLMYRFRTLDTKVQTLEPKALAQCGTLGGGNHFIEISVDPGGERHDGYTEPHLWIVLHSGSRNIGKTLAEIHIERARGLAHNADLPDPDLATFLATTPEMVLYRHDLYWAQEYARLNRLVMLDLIKQAIRTQFDHRSRISFDEPISCHHNYVSQEVHFGEQLIVTRKGAIAAERGKLGIIPGSMNSPTFIVRGLGNTASLNSASHGAGRKLSRTAAKKRFTLADVEAQTAGVECRKDIEIADEIRENYKDVRAVMRNQSDLVEIMTEITPILCVKG